ncbi:MAG: hypothetical protein IJW23_09390 [Lentisphaeria bacterium]|nr:hypothetical protein [Lentisphaeria bacterium]
MKRKIHLSKFNLVEIVLAIGVVALGMAAVLALLPPALNANRASQGDANTTEIASNMITYIDMVALDCAGNTSEFKVTTPPLDPANDDTTWCTALESRFETAAPSANSVAVPAEGASFNNLLDDKLFPLFNVESGSKDKPKWMTYIKVDEDGNKIPAANVYVWMKKINYEPTTSHEGIKGIGTGTTARSCYRFYIKVCWPADAPADADNREERTFVHEVVRPVKQ